MGTKLTSTFAVTDSQGRGLKVLEVTDVETGAYGDIGMQEEGRTSYQLETGEPCNRLSDTEFEVVGTGEQLTTINEPDLS